MKEAMLQGQLTVPSINADATVTANVKHDQELQLELESEIKLMDATSQQKIAMTYGNVFSLLRLLQTSHGYFNVQYLGQAH